jgi:hypothetical protein
MQQPGSRTKMKNICALQAEFIRVSKCMLSEGGHLNVGSKASNKILAELLYWEFK